MRKLRIFFVYNIIIIVYNKIVKDKIMKNKEYNVNDKFKGTIDEDAIKGAIKFIKDNELNEKKEDKKDVGFSE
jgi:hypothetical protein